LIYIGIIDTGVNVKHEALRDNYKNDNLSWLDGFGQYPEPHDGNSHGTHCMGTIAGNKNGIGVAPGAKYIACRGLDDEGSGNETTLMKCGEFMACPSQDEDESLCTGFPNVVSNSWGGLIGGLDFYNPVISVWKGLGIIPVFALGNSGPFCQTAGSPGDQDNLISVGATDNKDKVAGFSSRGPALVSRATKPEVSAPGKDIVSADTKNESGYKKLSGTSMACPHVAGAVALMLAANPDLKYEDVKKALETTAHQPKLGFMDSGSVCTLQFTPTYPNNGYGHGRIDVEAAVNKVTSPGKTKRSSSQLMH
jgi:subtilisin family serine protease